MNTLLSLIQNFFFEKMGWEKKERNKLVSKYLEMVVILQYTTNCLFCVPVFGLNTIMEIITEAGPVSNEGGFLAS